jgi:hypothetical protein
MKSDDRIRGTLSADDARDVLARAAELDAVQRDAVSVTRLRETAAEAGIGAESLDRAVVEVVARSDDRVRAPRWVRLGLFGVVDRFGAMAF